MTGGGVRRQFGMLESMRAATASLLIAVGQTATLSAAIPHRAFGQQEASIHGYSFELTDDSSNAAGYGKWGFRMLVRTAPAATRIQLGERGAPAPDMFALVDARTRIAYMKAKEMLLEGSIDAVGGVLGAVTFPSNDVDAYSNALVRDEPVPGVDTLARYPATHRRFVLTYTYYGARQEEQADCWYAVVPPTLAAGINHATHFFGISLNPPGNMLTAAVWAVPNATPIKCSYTWVSGKQKPTRPLHDTWAVTNVATDTFDRGLFVLPDLPHARSIYPPGVLKP